MKLTKTRTKPFAINLIGLSPIAQDAILFADQKLIGTEAYIGVAWFWNNEYKHCMREASIAVRRKVHKAFLKAGLPVDGESDKHLEIVARYAKYYN
jgi:hypothetical protein